MASQDRLKTDDERTTSDGPWRRVAGASVPCDNTFAAVAGFAQSLQILERRLATARPWVNVIELESAPGPTGEAGMAVTIQDGSAQRHADFAVIDRTPAGTRELVEAPKAITGKHTSDGPSVAVAT